MTQFQNIRDTYSNFIDSLDKTEYSDNVSVGNADILEKLFEQTLEIKDQNKNIQAFYEVLYRLYLFGSTKDNFDSSKVKMNSEVLEDLKEVYQAI